MTAITSEQRLRNLAALVDRLTEPSRRNVGKRPDNCAASKQEIAAAARQLAEEVEAYLDGTLEAVDGDTPF
jgi:hypothetical protein